MEQQIWLHEGHDGEPGLEAWAPSLLGFATWAPDEAVLRARLPHKLDLHLAWLRRHGWSAPAATPRIRVVGRVRGDEVLLPPDREPATPGEVDDAVARLAWSREDLLAEVEACPNELLDWDPPYRRFAPWADWRTIRATLAHVANGETWYCLRAIGHRPRHPSAPTSAGWRADLARMREEAVEFLRELGASADLARVRTVDLGFGPEDWSVRKALRRMVRHELLHLRSIRRIRLAFAARSAPGSSRRA